MAQTMEQFMIMLRRVFGDQIELKRSELCHYIEYNNCKIEVDPVENAMYALQLFEEQSRGGGLLTDRLYYRTMGNFQEDLMDKNLGYLFGLTKAQCMRRYFGLELPEEEVCNETKI